MKISSVPARAASLLVVIAAIVYPSGAQPGGSLTVHSNGNLESASAAGGEEPNFLNSGWVTAEGTGTAPVLAYSGAVEVRGKMWLRLHFGFATLSGERGDENASYLVLTSALDGASQTLWMEDLEAWSMSSAYFNGDRVLVELYASPQSGPSTVQVNGAEVGEPGWLDRSLCGPIDERIPSADPRTGRLLPSQCTAWLVSDLPNGMLTAGHCAVGPGAVVQFNVPASTIGGSMVHPDPANQYPVDPESKQTGSGGVGNDWMFIGVRANSSTGLSALAAQGSSHHLATTIPPADGRSVGVIGYGQVSQPVPLVYNYIQTFGMGPFVGATANIVRHAADTTGGDSGAPIIDLTTGLVLGVHTNGGCNGDGYNRGTSATRSTLRSALASPAGAAAEIDGLRFSFPQGRPAEVNPAGGTTIRVRVQPSDTRTPVADTPMLHVFDGVSWGSSLMERINNTVYRGTFPPVSGCASRVRYFISAENTLGELNMTPSAGATFTAAVDHPSEVLASYSFQQSAGWQVSNGAGLRSGAWAISSPPSVGRFGPEADFDGSGRCLLTGAASRVDVDGGRTTMTSPAVATCPAGDVHLSLALWHAATTPGNEGLVVEISTNGGASWLEIDRVVETDGWEMRVYRVRDYTTPGSSLRVRFQSTDTVLAAAPEGGIVESAIDRVEFYEPQCAAAGYDAPGGGAGIESFMRRYWAGDVSADLTGDGSVDISDLLTRLEYQEECP